MLESCFQRVFGVITRRIQIEYFQEANTSNSIIFTIKKISINKMPRHRKLYKIYSTTERQNIRLFTLNAFQIQNESLRDVYRRNQASFSVSS